MWFLVFFQTNMVTKNWILALVMTRWGEDVLTPPIYYLWASCAPGACEGHWPMGCEGHCPLQVIQEGRDGTWRSGGNIWRVALEQLLTAQPVAWFWWFLRCWLCRSRRRVSCWFGCCCVCYRWLVWANGHWDSEACRLALWSRHPGTCSRRGLFLWSHLVSF